MEIWSLGKANEPFIDIGIQIYAKRIKPMASVQLEILTLPKKHQTSDRHQLLEAEEALILSKLRNPSYLILLDERGSLLNSVQWSNHFQSFMNQGRKNVIFLIGGAYGVSPKIRSMAQQTWSLSPLVFPHQLVRLMVMEQVYRAYSILHNLPYHHH